MLLASNSVVFIALTFQMGHIKPFQKAGVTQSFGFWKAKSNNPFIFIKRIFNKTTSHGPNVIFPRFAFHSFQHQIIGPKCPCANRYTIFRALNMNLRWSLKYSGFVLQNWLSQEAILLLLIIFELWLFVI